MMSGQNFLGKFVVIIAISSGTRKNVLLSLLIYFIITIASFNNISRYIRMYSNQYRLFSYKKEFGKFS